MRKIILLICAAAATISSVEAQAQRDSVFRPRSANTGRADPSQLSIDVSQYDPNVQIGEILKTTKMLVQQNEQLREEVAEMQRKLNQLEKRGEAISMVLVTGTGEFIGSMVRKIKDKTVGPY